jgi:hypothetical protein
MFSRAVLKAIARCRDKPFVIESRHGGPRDRSRFAPGADFMVSLIKIVTARTTKFRSLGGTIDHGQQAVKRIGAHRVRATPIANTGDRSVLERIDGAIFHMARVISFIADQMLCRKKPRILIRPAPISLKRTVTRRASIFELIDRAGRLRQ